MAISADSPIYHCPPILTGNRIFTITLSIQALDGARRTEARDQNLLAGEAQRRTAAAFEPAQARFFAHDVVAGDRNDILSFGQLKLEHHHALLAERHFRGGEIEFPHAHETRVVEPLNLLAMREEALAPAFSVSA